MAGYRRAADTAIVHERARASRSNELSLWSVTLDRRRYELPKAGTFRIAGQRAVDRFMGHLRQPGGSTRRAGIAGCRARRRRQFLRQRRSVCGRQIRGDHGACAQVARLAAHQLCGIDEILLGARGSAESVPHPQPQIPAERDRRIAAASSARLRRPRVLPSSRSQYADRGNRMGNERHHRARQGALLGHIRMERRRDPRRVRNRGSASPAQADDGAAAVQPVPPQARRTGIQTPL
ncbi:Uncharacterised protein [Burkholderia pseudomallei]|nr:Uncharacterised protein [Burkholderia pseudomallei]